MQPINPFEPEYGDELVRLDRQAVTAFLHDYLRSGTVPELPKIHTGPSIRLDEQREPIGQCSWRWSEMRGKYIGCPYWSVEAMRVLERVQAENPTCSPRELGELASSRSLGDEQLQHAHVFSRKAWIELMTPHLSWSDLDETELMARLDQYCVACIVTYAENQQLRGKEGIRKNPWMRYQGSSIRLVHNAHWPEPHKSWIADAGLLDATGWAKSA
jgi:hypothetical protein